MGTEKSTQAIYPTQLQNPISRHETLKAGTKNSAKLPIRIKVQDDTQARRDARIASFNRREAAVPPACVPRPADSYTEYEWVGFEENIAKLEGEIRLAEFHDQGEYLTSLGKKIMLVDTVSIHFRELLSKPNSNVDKDTSMDQDLEEFDSDQFIKSCDGAVLAFFIKDAVQRIWGKDLGIWRMWNANIYQKRLTTGRSAYTVEEFCILANGSFVDGYKPVISRDLTSERFKNLEKRKLRAKAWQSFYQRMAPLLQTLGILFELLDPKNYRRYHTNWKKGFAKHLPFPDMDTTKRACWLGMGLLYNKHCGHHKDRGNVLNGFVPDLAFEDHDGGNVAFPGLGKSFKVRKGSVIFSRSAYLIHYGLPSRGECLKQYSISHRMRIALGSSSSSTKRIFDTKSAKSGLERHSESDGYKYGKTNLEVYLVEIWMGRIQSRIQSRRK
ncbi:MAG: hypothetical protein M1812_000604 [Candelaria pacifica]|nr:MAG: hypothetical protein M1812_000604 [Candelaria pacifica]